MVFQRKRFRLQLPSGPLALGERTLVMGVLNVTPDSFSDGGLYLDAQAAIARALEIKRAGADILDIGGESARPGAHPITAQEELSRIMPVLEGLRGRLKMPISIDTQKAEVAAAAVAAGAQIINDISALRADLGLADVARRHRLPLVLMHMRGTPRTMQKGPFARNVVRDVASGLRAAVARAQKAGVRKTQLVLDPGIGFGKTFAQNFQLLAHLPELARLGFPLLVGPSRKTFIGAALGGTSKPLPPEQRAWGTAATLAAAILGGVHIVRVHDVAEMVHVARITDALLLEAIR